MPPPFKPFVTFSRNEKYGLLVLTGLLVLLVLIRATMHFFVKPNIDEAQQTRLQQAWQHFQQTQTDTVQVANNTGSNQLDTSSALVNINTADSATLVDLDGIGPASAHKILMYRSQQQFTSFDQVRKLCHMSATNADLLKPHILIK